MAGLYIHVPFCHSKCAYCDFYSMPAARLADRYVDAAIHEFDCRREEIRESFTTVYLGGGTPSILTPSQLDRLISALPVSDAKEFTIEANPEDVKKEAVDFWISRGINRVSMGVQSFSNTWLLRDGQWDAFTFSKWKVSTNGTYIGSKEVPMNGVLINIGDIISIGDAKLRVEGY